MNSIFLYRSARAGLSEDTELNYANSSMYRRMTPLQKAVFIAICNLKLSNNATDFWDCFFMEQTSVFYTSVYGDTLTMYNLANTLYQNDLPLSPKDFQNSVFNAPLAYLMIQEKLHQCGISLTSGFSSPDSTLHLILDRLSTGLDRRALFIHASESFMDSDASYKAEAEVLCLGTGQFKGASHKLVQYRRGFELNDCMRVNNFTEQLIVEEQNNPKIPWLLGGEYLAPRRILKTLHGESFLTEWLPC